MANVHIAADQNTSFITSGGGSADRLLIAGNTLTNGDRYLALFKSLVGVSSGCTRILMRIGGVVEPLSEATMCAAPTNGQLKQVAGMHLFTADGISDVTVRVQHISGIARTGDEQLILINLDDVLVENTDWFYASNSNTDGTGGGVGFGGEAQAASLTFTPDGFSDYLVIGHLQFTNGGSSKAEAFRVQDVTNVATIAQTGPGHGNVATEVHSMTIIGVLQTPPQTAITLNTEYKSFPSLTKTQAQIFVLRLNKFTQRGFTFSDVNAVPTGSRQSIGSFQFTPDAAGDVALLSSFIAQAQPGFESGDGIIGDLEYAGAIEADLNDSGEHIAPSSNANFADSQIGPNFYRLLTGQAGQETVEGFVDSSPTVANVLLRRMTLVALGTEVIIPAPPQVPIRDPDTDDVEQARSTNIFFHIGGIDGVDISTIDVQLQIGGGGFFQAVQTGVAVFPFDGPQASVVNQTDGFDVTIDNRGIWPVNTLVDVRINADSVSGLSMPQVDYSFTTSSEAVASGVLVQVTRT